VTGLARAQASREHEKAQSLLYVNTNPAMLTMPALDNHQKTEHAPAVSSVTQSEERLCCLSRSAATTSPGCPEIC
jgi:hypothetical protein